MKSQPDELNRDCIADALAQRWGMYPATVEYLPVGGGGHHWLAVTRDSTRWFVTANGLIGRGHWLEADSSSIYPRTELAYETVRELNLPFALAAVPTRVGFLLYRVHPHWALSVIWSNK